MRLSVNIKLVDCAERKVELDNTTLVHEVWHSACYPNGIDHGGQQARRITAQRTCNWLMRIWLIHTDKVFSKAGKERKMAALFVSTKSRISSTKVRGNEGVLSH